MINSVMGNPSEIFDADAADLNEDGEVDVFDANADKEVNTLDIVDITNHMMDKPTSTGKFDEDAADLNNNVIVEPWNQINENSTF